MLLKDIKLGTNDISLFLGVSRRVSCEWCVSKKIKATRDKKNNWAITGNAFVMFLYHNPRYRNYFQNCQFSSPKKTEIQSMILTRLLSFPPIYSSDEIADIFCVARNSIRYWIKQEYIIPIKDRPSYGGKLFTEESITDFLQKFPEYQYLYDRYKKSK